MSTTVMRSSAFLNTLGVNTHLPYTDGGYANISNVIADIKYLGVDQVRDGISDGSNGSAPLSSYIAVAQAGVHFTFITEATTTATLQADIALVDQVNKAVPGSVTAVEGPNEINNQPITYNGVGGLQGALNLQTALYSMVHSDPNLSGVAVDYFTGYGNGGLAMGPDTATTPGLADYDNQHPYPNQGDAPEQWVNRTQALPNATSPTTPAVYTETGYNTDGGTSGGVNQDVQANYTLDLLMDDAKAGIVHTDLYQLMDAYQPGSPQGDDGFGLFDPSNAPKEAATAIHNLTTILADTGSKAATFTTTPLNYSVSGLASTGNSMELQKSNGATDIVMWNEPQIWNESKGTEITSPTDAVTLNLGATYQKVEVFDPLSSTVAVETLSNVSSVSLGLTDHPLIVEVEPQTGTTPPVTTPPVTTPPVTTPPVTTPPVTTPPVTTPPVTTPPVTTPPVTTPPVTTPPVTTPPVTTPPVTTPPTTDTLALNVSEDAYGSNAEFTVSVDGKQVGGDYTTHVVQSSGDAGTFLLKGDWSSGVNDVQVKFINDATSVPPSNLEVQSIAYNGVTDVGTSADLVSGDSDTFAVGGTTGTMPGPADTLTLNLSEDAWKGDADFVLYIDGKAVTTPQVVTALHNANQTQGFTFTGNWGAGTHTVGVAFVNDAYGGTTTTDRNLYINGVTVNGSDVFSGTKAQDGNGTSHFTVATSH
jgi:hypothetical protein